MSRPGDGLHREWKTFSQRRQASRLEKFLLWSALVHLVVLLVVVIPVGAARQQMLQERETSHQEQQAREQKEKEQILEQAQEEVTEETRKELAEEQLRTLFEEITAEFLTPQTMEMYWEEVLAELEPELTELANTLDQEEFDLAAAAERIPQIKDKMLKELEKLLARNAQKSLEKQLLAQAQAQTRALVKFYEKGLRDKVGHPVGDQLARVLQAEKKAATLQLQKADQDLTSALRSAEQAHQALKQASPRLRQHQQDLKAAGTDARAVRAARASLRKERSGALAVARALSTADKKTTSAATRLGAHLPGLADKLKKASTSAASAHKDTQELLKAAGTGKPAQAVENARSAEEKALATARALCEAQTTLRSQLKALANKGSKADKKTVLPGQKALARELEKLAREKLAGHVDKEFAKLLKENLLPALLKKMDTAVSKQLGTNTKLPASTRDQLRKEMEKALKGNLKRLEPGKVFAQATAGKLPILPRELATKKGPVASHTTSKVTATETQARRTIDRNLAVLIASSKSLLRSQHSTSTPSSGPHQSRDRLGALLNRLNFFRNQLAVGRRDFLGQADGTALAIARARQRHRRSSLNRLGRGGTHPMDLKTYRKVVQMMKERGRIVGGPLARKGAEGKVSQTDQEDVLRPARVYLPQLPEEKTEPNATNRKVSAPSFPTNKFSGIPFVARDAITIDGNLADWKDLPKLNLEPVPLSGSRKPTVLPKHQVAQLAYSPQGLLLAVDVVDTTGKLENSHPISAFWQNDGVEVYLDTLNTKYKGRGEINTHQFFAFPLGQKKDQATGGYESYMYREGGSFKWKIVAHARDRFPRAGKMKPDGKGWTLEMLIPRNLLRHGKIKPGQIIGFNVQVDTGSNTYYFWSNPTRSRISMKPNLWGDIQLLGSDARLEIIGKDDRETLRALLPGKSLRIRVTDPDMNLDDQRKDKVSVTVRSASGDTETVILEETEKRSGAFVGSVASRLNIGVHKPAVVEVFEGEKVTIEYIDQARAFGERNVPVKMTVAVGSIGTTLPAPTRRR